MNAIFLCMLRLWQDLTCPHHWVRARHADGSYGFRCMDCWKPYPHTWNELINQPVPGAPAQARALAGAAEWPAAAILQTGGSEPALRHLSRAA